MSRYTMNKMLAGGAHLLSVVLSPLLMPTYGTFLVLWASVLCLLPHGTRVAVLVVCMGITCILPLIFLSVLRHFKLVTDLHVERRNQRLVPYLFAVVCYAAAASYLYNCHSPQWFVMFMAGAALSVLLSALITLKWKISAHMTGMGGIVALIYQLHVQGLSAFEMYWLLCAAILLSGLLGSARLILNRHSTLQVIAGFVLGYACVTITMKFLG